MVKIFAVATLFSLASAAPALAVNTWAGSSPEDMAEEQEACAADAYRFCGGNTLFIFEMENCLKRHMGQLSKPCRRQLSPTDFRKYYKQDGWPFDF